MTKVPLPQLITTANQPPEIGPFLRNARTSRSLTLDQLAERSKVSKSMLSQVERGEANPTFAVLWAITHAMGMDVGDVIAGTRDDQPQSLIDISGSLATPVLRGGDGLCVLRILSPPQMAGVTEWYDIQIESQGQLESAAHAKGAAEHLTVLNGEMRVEVEGHTRIVRSGETARYPVDRRHIISNPGISPARALLVVVYDA